MTRVRPTPSKPDTDDLSDISDAAACIELFDVDRLEPPFRKVPRPHSEMELYQVHMRWREAECFSKIAIVDCDCVLSCYEEARRVILRRWRRENPTSSADRTWHIFLTNLAYNGARALCDAYYGQSADSSPARFEDHRWAACLSTVLAEDYYRVFAELDEMTPEWAGFLRAGDREFRIPLSMLKLHGYLDSSRAFAKAHTRDGLRRAIVGACGRPPAAKTDLETVAEILIQAQKPLLNELRVLAPLGPSVGPFVARTTFAMYLREAIDDALA